MEAARAAEASKPKPKKRKRRTKAEMEAARAAETPPEPQWWEQGYTGPRPTSTKVVRKPRSYPKPEPKPKFDTSLIDEISVLKGGAKYARTVETKNGRHILTWSSMTKDWSILYDARYNDTDHHWAFHLRLKDSLEERDTPKKKGRKRVKK